MIERLRAMPHRLADWGYEVSTGPLVWNRHKNQLREHNGPGCLPLIWAEAVRPDGRFLLQAKKTNHRQYFRPRATDGWLVIRDSCVLVQRTTAKEQPRRLVAAVLPNRLIREHGGAVIENHLNMIRPSVGRPLVAPSTLAAFLNSDAADRAFRCLSGSVAVSAYELEALPLPPPEDLQELDTAVRRGASRDVVDRICRRLFLGQPGVVLLSESQAKIIGRDEDLIARLHLRIEVGGDLPDILLVDLAPQDPLLVFVEVVATDGAVTAERKAALLRIARNAGFDPKQVAFVSAYLDRDSAGFRKTVSRLAWGSVAWFASEPDRLLVQYERLIGGLTSLADSLHGRGAGA